MLRKGTQVTSAILTTFFQRIYRKINWLSNKELNQLTSGQFMIDTEMEHSGTDVRLVYSPPNVFSTEYLSNSVLRYGDKYLNLMYYYEKELDRIGG